MGSDLTQRDRATRGFDHDQTHRKPTKNVGARGFAQAAFFTPPQVKYRCALARSGYTQYPAYRGRAFVWLGFRRMQSDISRAGRPVGHSAKSLCEIGLKAPPNVYEKTYYVGLLGGVELGVASSAWSSERLAAVLIGFWAAFEATSWGSRWGAEPLAARLPLTTQLDFEPLRRFVSVPHHRDMSTSRVEWLGTEVVCACVSSFHGSMDEFRRSRTVRSCSADRTLAGIPAATERARVACRASARFVLSNREAAARSIFTRSLVL